MTSGLSFDPLIHVVVVGFLVVIFARAGYEKLHDYGIYVATLRDYRLAPQRLVSALAAALIAAEAVTLVLLIVPGLSLAGGVAAMALFVLYGVAMSLALRAGRTSIECGCGGQGQIVSWLLVGRNVVLVAFAALVLVPVTSRPLSWLDGIVALCAILVGWLLLATAEKSIETAAAIRRLETESFL